MPPHGGKGKNKVKENRQSRSRNTTPGSVGAAAIITGAGLGAGHTSYLEIPIIKLTIPTIVSYDEILEKYRGSGGIPDPKHLDVLANNLNILSQSAQERGQACDGGMRELSKRRKERLEEEREKEQATREAEERESLKRAAEDEEDTRGRKGTKVKKRKEHSSIREERPLTHGAHGLTRQDGGDTAVAGIDNLKKQEARKSKNIDSAPPKRKEKAASGSSSSLSPASQVQSPIAAIPPQDNILTRASPSPSNSSLDSHQTPPAPSITQHQTFGPDPLTFDDPTVYHIREVTDDMTEEEKMEIYGVTQFPHDDLGHLIAGVPPDKDFSNAKPTNQVHANTFSSYLELFTRGLTEEDMAFLRERGDRVTPFLMPPRGKKTYTEVWAEEDGSISVDNPQSGRDKLPPNQPRGNIDQIDDDNLETDQVSAGPLLNRLLSAMRPEYRTPVSEDKKETNGTMNGIGEPSTNGFMNGDLDSFNLADIDSANDQPPATYMPDYSAQSWKIPAAKLDYAQIDERLKIELRHIGFLPPDTEPDYDAHYDDDVAERLRFLQAELKKQSIINGARKARVLQLAQERMAHQEYSTILDDLDTQVQQAYLKRNRTLGKGKKNAKRPGGAGGGSHYPAGTGPGGASSGVTKPGIGDVARTLMERRKKWIDTIKPVFSDDATRVRIEGESIFDGPQYEALVVNERERWDEEIE